MELLQITLAASETRQFAKAGRYFEIIDSLYALQINFTGPSGNISDSIVGALSGLFLEDPFTHFSLTNGPAAQTLTLLIMETGRGGSRRQPGNVVVVDSVSPLVQTVGTSPALTPGIFSTTIVAAVAGVQLLVRGFSLENTSGAGGQCLSRIAAGPAPVATTTGNHVVLASTFSNNGTTQVQTNTDLRKRLPVGWGLYMFSAVTAVNNVSNSSMVSYEPQ